MGKYVKGIAQLTTPVLRVKQGNCVLAQFPHPHPTKELFDKTHSNHPPASTRISGQNWLETRTNARALPTHTCMLAGIVALHLAIAWVLLQLAPARWRAPEPSPITVQLLPPQALAMAKTQPAPSAKATPRPTAAPMPLPAPEVEPPPNAPAAAVALLEKPALQATVGPATPLASSTPVQAALEPPRADLAYLDNPPPRYPTISKRLGETGSVLLRVLVSAQGQALEVEVKTSSGYARLDTAAVEAVRQWKFLPARRGDTAVSGWALVPLHFVLSPR